MSPPLLQTLHLSHLPSDLSVHVALYTDLQNAAFLRKRLLQGDPGFEYAFIEGSVILSTTHVLAAVFRAANDYLSGRLKSRNVHSEIVFSLGGNNNISQSLTTFGISPLTTTLLIIKLSLTPEITASSVSAHLGSCVQGTAVTFGDEALRGVADLDKIRRVYKLGGSGGVGGMGKGKGRRRRKDGSVEGSGGVGGVREGEVRGEGEGEGDEREREKEREMRELEVNVLGLMALRGAV